MTIASATSRISYTGDGGTTAFAVPFYFQANADLVVYLTDTLGNRTLQVLGTHYTLTGATLAAGGSCTMVTAPVTAYTLTIYRDPAMTQTTSYNNNDPFPAKAHELALDKALTIDQRTRDIATRSLHLSDAEGTSTSTELAAIVTRKNRLLGFDTTGALTYGLAPTFVAGATTAGVADVDTRATAALTTFAAGINAVVTSGLATAGDGGGATYIRGVVGDPGAFQDGGAVYWKFGSIPGAVVQMDTRVSAAAARYAANVNIVVTNGYTTAGDGGGARYKRGIITSPGAFQDAYGVYWGLDLGAGIVLASWFGAVGDDSTNDYTALQAGITAAQAIGGEFHLNPGKKYYVSGNDLTIAIPSGCRNFCFYGNGSQIRTNPAEARTALKVQHAAAVTRADQNRKVLISGVTIYHFDNATALWGIHVVGSTHVTIRDCSFVGGSDTGVAMSVNYGSIHFVQSDIHDPNTGCFWCRVQGCDFVAGTTRITNGIFIQGGHNAMIIENNSISLCTIAILFSQPAAGLNANDAVMANGVRIVNNEFEGINFGVYVQGTAAWSAIHGLIVSNNRIESVTTVFFNYLLNTAPFTPPIIGPNYIGSADWPPKYISNLNGLYVDVRDEFVAHTTVDPASIAAGATSAFTTVTVNPATINDHVTAETTANLNGLQLTGYVSGANTVTLRLTNATTGAIDLGSMKFLVRVRPQY